MSQSATNLAEEIARFVQINRARLNGLEYGTLVLKVHKGRLVAVTTSEELQLSSGSQLRVPPLKSDATKSQP